MPLHVRGEGHSVQLASATLDWPSAGSGSRPQAVVDDAWAKDGRGEVVREGRWSELERQG